MLAAFKTALRDDESPLRIEGEQSWVEESRFLRYPFRGTHRQ